MCFGFWRLDGAREAQGDGIMVILSFELYLISYLENRFLIRGVASSKPEVEDMRVDKRTKGERYRFIQADIEDCKIVKYINLTPSDSYELHYPASSSVKLSRFLIEEENNGLRRRLGETVPIKPAI